MSKFFQINRHMPIEFYACVNETITDPELVVLADRMQMPNLLMCDTPLKGASFVIDNPEQVGRILTWLLTNEKWLPIIEDTLQGMANDSQGRPLLTAFMPIEEFTVLADELATSLHLVGLDVSVTEWRKLGATTGYIDVYEGLISDVTQLREAFEITDADKSEFVKAILENCTTKIHLKP